MPNMTLLQEAVTTAGTVTPLIPKAIDPVLLEYQRRYSPLLAAIPTKQWNSTQYFFNRRVNRPDSGAVIDGGARPISNSTYEQSVYNIRLFQAVGSVTGFAQTVTRDIVGDLRQIELDGTVQSMLWTVENSFIWGNDPATANGVQPMCSGLDYLVSNWTAGTGSNAFVNAQDVNGSLTLAKLDELIDLVETNAAMPIDGSPWMFIMSGRMVSAVSQLFVNQQRFQAPTTHLGGGLNVPSYRDVPMIKSSFLSPRSFGMGTVATATATTGGVLGAATYYYQVSAVVARFGEIAASVEVNQTTTGATSTVTLTFSTPTGLPDNAGPILYKVYRSTSTTTETLIGVVDAFDTTGVATTTIIDTGANLLTNSSGNTGTTAYVGTNAGAKPKAAGGSAYEDIYLISRDPNFVVRPYTRNMQILPLAPTVTAPDTLPFAVLTDTTLALRAPKYAGRLSRVVAAI